MKIFLTHVWENIPSNLMSQTYGKTQNQNTFYGAWAMERYFNQMIAKMEKSMHLTLCFLQKLE